MTVPLYEPKIQVTVTKVIKDPGMNKGRKRASRLRDRFAWATLCQRPISKRWVIHFQTIVVSLRSRTAHAHLTDHHCAESAVRKPAIGHSAESLQLDSRSPSRPGASRGSFLLIVFEGFRLPRRMND